MPVVMPTVTGTRANVARHAGSAPKRTPAQRATDAERFGGRTRIRGASIHRRLGSNVLQPVHRIICMIIVVSSSSNSRLRLCADGSLTRLS